MNQSLIDQLKKDPEALKQAALEAGLITDEEAKKVFAPIKVDSMATTEELTTQFNEKLAGMEKYFKKELKAAKASGQQAVQESSKEAELQKIRDFAKTHPEMKAGSDVTNLMEQLYANDQDLEKVYKQACKANDLTPIAITEVDGKEVRTDMTSGKEVDKDGKAVEKETKKPANTVVEKIDFNSLKSDEHNADSTDLDDGELKKQKSIEGKSVREIAADNWNQAIVDAGGVDPFAND